MRHIIHEPFNVSMSGGHFIDIGPITEQLVACLHRHVAPCAWLAGRIHFHRGDNQAPDRALMVLNDVDHLQQLRLLLRVHFTEFIGLRLFDARSSRA
jgi:hypothetical protein